MSFLRRIKRDMHDLRNGRMGRDQLVRVNSKDLSELVRNFEEIDSYLRATDIRARERHINEQLQNTIRAAYEQQGRDSESTLMLVMDTLRPLMEERYQESCSRASVLDPSSESRLMLT